MMTVVPVVSHLDYKKPYFVTPDVYFNVACNMHVDWLNDPVVEEMVLDIDNTKHIKDYIYDSPFIGAIPPQMLSGGVKGLILILKDTGNTCRVFASKMFGDNCVEWLRKLSFQVDFTILMCHPLGWNAAYIDRTKPLGEEFSGPYPICAQTMDGMPLNTTSEVIRYYDTEFDKLWEVNKENYTIDYEPLTEEDFQRGRNLFNLMREGRI